MQKPQLQKKIHYLKCWVSMSSVSWTKYRFCTEKSPILFQQDTVPLSLPFSWGGDLDPSSITQFINSGQHIVNCFPYQFALREESYWGTFPSFKEDTLAVTSCITINVSPCFFQLLSKLAALRKHFQKKSNRCAFLVFFYARLYKGIKCDFIWKDTLNYYILGFFASVCFIYILALRADSKRTSSLTFGQPSKSPTLQLQQPVWPSSLPSAANNHTQGRRKKQSGPCRKQD